MRDFIARLRDRIAIEVPQKTPDGAGGEVVVWSELDRVWAEVSAVNSVVRNAEVFKQEQNQVRKIYKVVMRYRDDLTEEMRVVHLDKVLNIRAIIVPSSALDVMELVVEEGVHV